MDNQQESTDGGQTQQKQSIMKYTIFICICFILIWIPVLEIERDNLHSAGLKQVLSIQAQSSVSTNRFMNVFAILSDEYSYLVGISFVMFGMSFKFGIRCLAVWMTSLYMGGFFALIFRDARPSWLDLNVDAFRCEPTLGTPALHSQHALVMWVLIAAEVIQRNRSRKILSHQNKARSIAVPVILFFSVLMMLLTGICQIWIGLNFAYQMFVGWAIALLILCVFMKVEKVLGVMVNEHFTRSDLRSNILLGIGFSVLMTALSLVPYGVVSKNFQVPDEWQQNYSAKCGNFDLSATLGQMMIAIGCFAWMPLIFYMRQRNTWCYFEAYWGFWWERGLRGILVAAAISLVYAILGLIRRPVVVAMLLRYYLTGAAIMISMGLTLPWLLYRFLLLRREVSVPLPAIDTDLTDIRSDDDLNNLIALQSLVIMNRRQKGGSQYSGSKDTKSLDNASFSGSLNHAML
mmetsp:Transcript_25537/g.33379  ORF Transcript_25537/g.33379 Transcript_25537/m.33379 type:complete len:461 (-) Transcript_25537:165-1547(-)